MPPSVPVEHTAIGVQPYDPPKYAHEPKTLDQLIALPLEQLAEVDIARMNLVCGTGLPGAEGLDVEECIDRLDDWAKQTYTFTHNALPDFHRRPQDFDNSEAKFRMLLVLSVLQKEFGIHYQEDGLDVNYKSARYPTIVGMMNGTAGGNCASMPVMYVAVGRRLGYPLSLMLGKTHIFARWDGMGEDDVLLPIAYRDRFNVEGTNPVLSTHPDSYYRKWPYPISDAEMELGWYMKPLTSVEELGVFMGIRANVLMENEQYAAAAEAFMHSYRLAPQNPEGQKAIEITQAIARQLSDQALAAMQGRSPSSRFATNQPRRVPGRVGHMIHDEMPTHQQLNPIVAQRMRMEQQMMAEQERRFREALTIPVVGPAQPMPPRPGQYRNPHLNPYQSPGTIHVYP